MNTYNKDSNSRSRERSRQKNVRRDNKQYDNDNKRRWRSRSRSSSDQRRRDHDRDRNDRNRHQRHNSHRRSSRSNSKDRNDYYPEKKAEEVEQRLRLAIRNNQIHFDAKLLQILRSMSLERQEELKYQADSIDKISECILVRELFISGLEQMNENFIRENLQPYGSIQKIEIVRNFAYVRFNRVSDASNACSEYHTINMKIHNIHNPNFKIFFSDHVKRWNVVSNNAEFQNVDDMVPVIYTSIRNDPPYNTQAHLREIFMKFGYIRNIEVKVPAMKSYKAFALIEYETLTQALRARQRIKPNREKYLGDRKSQITLLLDSEKYSRQFPNVKHQLKHRKRKQYTTGPQSLMPQQINKTINPYLSQMQPQKQPQQMIPQIQHHNQQEAASDIFAMIRQFAQKQPDADQEESDWVGFMTRKKQFKVEVDFNLIHKVPFELESIINVSHRGDLQQATTREDYVMAGKFKAVNNLNVNAFNEYINYLTKKNRAGIIQTKNYLIYLLPPIDSPPLPYPIKKNEMLALFFKL